jgi:hypothetical protein
MMEMDNSYLILGGGILNTQNSYLGKTNTTVDSEEFASAGLGLYSVE